MSMIFGNPDRIGCFTAQTLNTAGSRGVVVRLPQGGTVPGYDLSDPYLVTDLAFSLEESAQFNKLFGDTTAGYAFGHNPASSVLGVTIMGFNRMSGRGGDIISEMYDIYSKGRVFSSERKAAISSGGAGLPLEGYITGIKSHTQDETVDIQMFTLTLTVTDI